MNCWLNAWTGRICGDSHLYLDGFTGFTPVQMDLIRKLMTRVESMIFVFTIDASQIGFTKPKEYELFQTHQGDCAGACENGG